MELSAKELKQYSRHIILNEIGISGQQKLKNSSVLVIGAGGLGCPILSYLTACGIGRIGIIDFDIVEQSNLQRQVLYSESDIGLSKVEVASRKLCKLNSLVNFDLYNQKLTKLNAVELFSKYDIVVDGSDNFSTRYLVNDAAIIVNIPLVYGSIYKFEGQVSVFNYNNGPTYRCLYPKNTDLKDGLNCSESGVMGALVGIIGSMQANEVIKIICGVGDIMSGKLLIIDSLTLKQSIIKFQKNENNQINELEEDYENCSSNYFEEITLKELKKLVFRYELLDVRTDFERNELNIGGIHIPLNDLPSRFNEIPSNNPIIVYCKSGVRSLHAIDYLKQKGFKNQLINLKGGILNSE